MSFHPTDIRPADGVHGDDDVVYPGDDVAMVSVPAAQVAEIADLFAVLDEFLRSGNGAADRLAAHLATQTEAAHQQHYMAPGHRLGMARYDANLLIDRVSFTAHVLRHHRPGGDRP